MDSAILLSASSLHTRRILAVTEMSRRSISGCLCSACSPRGVVLFSVNAVPPMLVVAESNWPARFSDVGVAAVTAGKFIYHVFGRALGL